MPPHSPPRTRNERTRHAPSQAQDEEELKQAALVAEIEKQPFDVEQLGFVSSTQRFAQYMARHPGHEEQLTSRSAATQAAA
jgi:hypothetical protein